MDSFELTVRICVIIIKVAVIAAKIIAVVFGVPFDESYHNDFKYNYTLKSNDKELPPPKILGYGEGFSISSNGVIPSFQCVDCGIFGEFTVDARLGFTLSGITNGSLSLVNPEPFQRQRCLRAKS